MAQYSTHIPSSELPSQTPTSSQAPSMSSHSPLEPVVKKEWKFDGDNSIYEPPAARRITTVQQTQIRPEFRVNRAETITSINPTSGIFMLNQPSISANQIVSTADTPPPETLLNISQAIGDSSSTPSLLGQSSSASSSLSHTTLSQPSISTPFFAHPLPSQIYPPQAPPAYGSSVYQQYQSANKARRLMPPPRAPNPVSFRPTSLPTPQPLKRPRDYAADDLDEAKASTILPPIKKQNQSLTKAERMALKGKRLVVDGDDDDGGAMHSAPPSRKRRPRPIDATDEKKFKQLSVYCSSPLRQYIRETYGSPTSADQEGNRTVTGDNQGQAYEGGSEGTITGGSSPS
ncbi:hypothetical protein EV426DRAFT_209672 [Tirmania nivea]|nr:hypothetical protein EV426DRAFT_209672 [Tirmania nivea]